MNDDIVARLRDCTCVPHGEICREAADEIERLRRDYSCICNEMRRMMDERDEARLDACMSWAWMYRPSENAENEARKEAKRRGWNCFKENTND
jgi:hypothetical protein